ncbi:MAG: cyclic lactone autoinducer peptide [Clostridia bacterium]|jgi:cyclic lactone autoinducer peptide|nr:cyclic lactone autoinducer peptide [Clostridia bacterium]
MKNLNHKVLMVIAAASTIFASLIATSACVWASYQPEEPKCLREE